MTNTKNITEHCKMLTLMGREKFNKIKELTKNNVIDHLKGLFPDVIICIIVQHFTEEEMFYHFGSPISTFDFHRTYYIATHLWDCSTEFIEKLFEKLIKNSMCIHTNVLLDACLYKKIIPSNLKWLISNFAKFKAYQNNMEKTIDFEEINDINNYFNIFNAKNPYTKEELLALTVNEHDLLKINKYLWTIFIINPNTNIMDFTDTEQQSIFYYLIHHGHFDIANKLFDDKCWINAISIHKLEEIIIKYCNLYLFDEGFFRGCSSKKYKCFIDPTIQRIMVCGNVNSNACNNTDNTNNTNNTNNNVCNEIIKIISLIRKILSTETMLKFRGELCILSILFDSFENMKKLYHFFNSFDFLSRELQSSCLFDVIIEKCDAVQKVQILIDIMIIHKTKNYYYSIIIDHGKHELVKLFLDNGIAPTNGQITEALYKLDINILRLFSKLKDFTIKLTKKDILRIKQCNNPKLFKLLLGFVDDDNKPIYDLLEYPIKYYDYVIPDYVEKSFILFGKKEINEFLTGAINNNNIEIVKLLLTTNFKPTNFHVQLAANFGYHEIGTLFKDSLFIENKEGTLLV